MEVKEGQGKSDWGGSGVLVETEGKQLLGEGATRTDLSLQVLPPEKSLSRPGRLPSSSSSQVHDLCPRFFSRFLFASASFSCLFLLRDMSPQSLLHSNVLR